MKYIRSLPAVTYTISNSGKEPQKNGPPKILEGTYARFKGNPPEFDSMEEAVRVATWEKKTRAIKYSEYDARVAQLDKEICEFIEGHKDYADGKIQKLDPLDRLREKFEIHPCPFCKERVFQTLELLGEHLRGEHGVKSAAIKKVEEQKEAHG